MPGISTSAMMQDVSLNRGEDKNSCAEANAYAENPIDLNNRVVAVRIEASSSMIEITGTSATRPDLLSRPGPPQAGPRQRRLIHEIREGFADGEVYLGFEMGKRHQFIALGAVRSNGARGYDGTQIWAWVARGVRHKRRFLKAAIWRVSPRVLQPS